MGLKQILKTIKDIGIGKISYPSEIADRKNKLFIISTGPSAAKYMYDEKVQKDFLDNDIMIINATLIYEREIVFKLKPQYLVLCDQAFWEIDSLSIKIKNVLEQIDWKVFLITTVNGKFNLHNPNISIFRLNGNRMSIGNCGCSFLYNRNWAIPNGNNVVLFSLFFGILCKYEIINLIGCEYDAIAFLHFNESGEIIAPIKHYYGTHTMFNVTDLLKNSKSSPFIAYVERYLDSLNGYMAMKRYADKRNCKIINYSENSFLDMYEKGKIDDIQ